ncbi:beta strand repeat-containing protein, partial [Helicobacter cappadocius]
MKNIMNSDKNNKIMSSNAQNSVIAPPPLTFLKSNSLENFENPKKSRSTEKYNKSFIPVISFVLSTFLFSFSGELRADTLGDASCTLGDSASCAKLISEPNGVSLTPLGSDQYNLNFNMTHLDFNKWQNENLPNKVINLTANNAIINSNGKEIYGNNTETKFNFKNSVLNGTIYFYKFLSYGAIYPYRMSPDTLNFDGSYQGDSNPSLKDYAFVGDLKGHVAKSVTFNFANNANWKGNTSIDGWYTGHSSYTFNFTNSSLEGNITGPSDNDHIHYSTTTLNYNFSGNSDKGFALKGANGASSNISAARGAFNLSLDKGAKAYANITMNYNGFSGYDTQKVNLTLNDNSFLQGNVVSYMGTINANLTDSSMIGGIKNSTGTAWKWNLDNSSVDTKSAGITIGNGATFNFDLKNNSSLIGKAKLTNSNITVTLNNSSWQGGASGNRGNFNLNLDQGSKASGDITFTTDGTTYVGPLKANINLNNGSILEGKMSTTNGKITINADNDSKINGNLTLSGNFYNVSFNPSATVNLTKSSWVGNITIDNSGTSNNLNVNLTLNNNSSILGNITTTTGSTNLTLNAASSADTITSTGGNTTLNANSGSSVSTINNNGGTGKYTFDNSTLNTYNTKVSNGTLTLNNNSVLNNLVVTNGNANIFLNSGSTLNKINLTAAPSSTTTNITADNASIGNQIYVNNGAKAILNISNNSKIGTPSSASSTYSIGAAWGSINATIDNSNVYGALTWQDGTLNANFTNNSKLIGDIGFKSWPSPSAGNVNGSGNISFADSSMEGDINVLEKTKNKGTHTSLTLSFTGNSSYKGSINVTDGGTSNPGGASLNASFTNTALDIKEISASAAKSDSTLSFTNISNAKIGNIAFDNGTLTGDFSFSSLGNIINTNANSSISLKDTQAQSYGNIGSSAKTYNGSLLADFDFTPSTNSDTSDTDSNVSSNATSIGDIYLGSNSTANLSFTFAGLNADGSLINKQAITDPSTSNTRNVTITGGSDSSSFSFSNIGTLDLSLANSSDASSADGSAKDIIDSIAKDTGISLSNVKGSLGLLKTNVVLNTPSSNSSTLIANSIFSLAGTDTTNTMSKAALNTGNNHFKILKATFGNATLGLDNGTGIPVIIANNANNPSDVSSFYTLSNRTHTSATTDKNTEDGFVLNKSSDADIGYTNDNVEKHINFIFTEGSFDKNQSGYTGTISGGTANSTYGFYNAGSLNVSQITNYLGSLTLYQTSLVGVLGKSTQSTATDGSVSYLPKDVSIALDYSGEDSNPYGLAIVGTGKHNITFNFTDNDNAVKFGGTLLGGSTNKLAGSNNTDNQITIYGLEGLGDNNSVSNSLIDELKNAGVSFNQTDTSIDGSSLTDASSKAYINGYDNVNDTDKQSIAKGTTFKFLNTTFNSDLKESDYALDLTFASQSVAEQSNIKNAANDSSSLIINPNKLFPLSAASYKGTLIDLSDNIYDNSLSFLGEGAISNANNLVKIKLGTGKTTLTAIDTQSTLVLSNTDKVNAASSLNLSNTSLIGDWSNGGNFIFGDNALVDSNNNPELDSNNQPITFNSKFYGKISNSANTALNITLNENSILSSSNSNVINFYEGSLKNTSENTFDVPTISFNNKDNSKNKLILNNPGGMIKIEGLNSNINLSDDSSLISNNTSIIGDITTKINKQSSGVFADLSFNTTGKNSAGNPISNTFYQGDNIGLLKKDSTLSFVGKYSIRSSKYDSTTQTDSGWVNIALPGNKEGLNLELNNTGANVILSQAGSTVGWFAQGNYNIRGTNIKVENGMDSDNGTPVSSNMVFAKASDATQDTLLKTQDGSLLTSSTDASGNTKNINDYIEASSLSIAKRIQIRGGTQNYTFIGDSSIATSTDTTLLANFNTTINVNLINLGEALNSNAKVSGKNVSDILFASNTGGGNTQSAYNYTLKGTSLGDTTVSSGTAAKDSQKVKVNFSAIFDNRDLDKRVDSNNNAQTSLQYYSDNNTIGNTKLDIAKSALNGKLVLGTSSTQDLITANLDFYGNDSFTSNASISGGSSSSTFSFHHMDLDFNTSSSARLNIKGQALFDVANIKGVFDGVGSGTYSTSSIKAADGKTSTNGILAFSDGTAPSIDVSNIDNIDYTNLAQGGSFKGGVLNTTKGAYYTFIGANSQGFNTAAILDSTDNTISNKDQITTLGSNLDKATINVIDGGALIGKNLEGTQAGTSNTLNLLGKTSLAVDENKNISINSAGLTINATIDSSNAALWNGGATDAGVYSDFNIIDPQAQSDKNQSAIYHFTFNGNYGSVDYDHQFYKGSITGLSSASQFTFNNAGYLYDKQFENTQAMITLHNTVIKGNISTDNINLDFRPSSTHPEGLMGLSGNIIKADSTNTHQKNISFDFTGNTLSDKIINSSASDKSYYLAGDKGSEFSFINLTDNTSDTSLDTPEIKDGSISWQDSTTSNDGVFNTLAQAGVHLRAAQSTASVQEDGEKLLTGDYATLKGNKVPQNLDKDVSFNFYGSTIYGDTSDESINSSYSLGFIFDNRANAQDRLKASNDITETFKLQSTLNQSSFIGKSIQSDKDLSVALYGKGAFKNEDNTLTLKAGEGRALNILAKSDEGSMGVIAIDDSLSTAFAAGSTLDIQGAGFKGIYLTSTDKTDPKNPKGGSIKAVFDSNNELLENSILGTKDGSLNVSIDYTSPLDQTNSDHANNTDSSKAPTFIIGSGTTNLSFTDAGIIKINSSNKTIVDSITDSSSQTSWDSSSAGTYFGANSTLTSKNTSIIGDIYGNSFQTSANG